MRNTMNSHDYTNTCQSLESLFNKTSQHTAQKTKLDLLHILNQTQHSNQARIQNMELTKAKEHIQGLATDAVIKTYKMRENQLIQQIDSLREDLQMMDKHFHELNQKYIEKRDQANQFMEQAMEVNEKYDLLTQKYLSLDEKYKKREKQIVENFSTRFQQQTADFQEKNSLAHMKIKQLETNNKQLLQLLKSAEKQNLRLKQVQEVEKAKRKSAEEDYKKQIEEIRAENDRQRVELTILRRQVQEKQNQVIQRDQNVKSMEKSMREMSQRVVKIEKDTQREILKQKVKAQKALDGLKMTRKYSELELSKSRKKQKYYMHSQKELLEKVKEIVKDQNLIDTIDKSSKRGGSTKSLNTTLKILKPQRQSSSPFVSNFMVDDESIVDLSPISKINQNKQLNLSNYHSTGVSSHINSARTTGIAKCKVEIPAGLSTGYYAAGTPCFQSQRGQMFKANR